MKKLLKFLDEYFGITKVGSSFRKEIFGGIVTFLTLSYIIFVNPSILINAIPASEAASADFFGALMVATIISSVIGTFVMAIYAKYPFALAPGMGLNAFFTYGVCIGMGIDWRVALAAIFIEGIIFIIITLVGIRSLISRAIPMPIKMSIAVGIGFFIAFIGFQNSGMVIADQATLVTMGNLGSKEVIVTVFGLFLITILYALKIPGSVLFGILGSSILSWILGVASFQGVIGKVPSIAPVFGQLNLSPSNIFTTTFWLVVLTFFFVDFFDTAGTLIGLSNAAGFADKETGDLARDKQAYMADAVATTAGAVLGTSTTTTYIESAAGIAEGARTGFASIVTGFLMLLMLFFSPLAASIPGAATAPALIFVGFLMMKSITKINWDDITDGMPAFITLITMPLTYSIAHGIALGFISYPIIKLFTGKKNELSWLSWVLFAIFIVFLIVE